MYIKPNFSKFFREEHHTPLQTVSDLKFTVVGIDPSILGTGVTVMKFDSRLHGFISSKSFVIPPDFIQTKEYVTCRPYKKIHHEHRTSTELESTKLANAQSIADEVVRIINEETYGHHIVSVGIEGLAFNTRGNGRNTSSNIYDLAGLNYMIRDRVTNYLRESEAPKKYVESIPPKTNKAAFVHGNADKPQMWEQFCEIHDYYGVQGTMNTNKEKYLYDVVDSYSIARIEVFRVLEERIMPKKQVKPKKELPYTIKKKFKIGPFNFRIIEITEENNRRAVLPTSSIELPLKINKSRSLKSIIEEVKVFVNDKWKLEGEAEATKYFTKKSKK